MMATLVSVIMPTYNCGQYIVESVRSVIDQTITDWEIEIVDDCSTDNTQEVLQPYLDMYPNIHYYRLNENMGPAGARTEAIKRATGRYVAFLDSDDLWLPDKLEKQISFMKETGVKFSCTAYRQMSENGELLNVKRVPPQKTDYKKMLRLGDPIGNSTVVYDQSVLGKYEVPPIKKRNDFALWLRILRDAPYCMGMDDVLTVYRIRQNSVSSNKIKLIKYNWQLYREIEHLSIPRSICAVCSWAIVKVMKCDTVTICDE